ncbi:MAG: MarC family protein [Chitinophagales bacterium]|nr:MarC family protein [Chitinophagales bacterium]
MYIHPKDILSLSITLFTVIDILGTLPALIDIQEKTGKISAIRATLVSLVLMILILWLGESILKFFGVNKASFAVAGSIIIFIIAMEMILGRNFFKQDHRHMKSASVVPIAFPLIAGAGTLTTIISLKSQYNDLDIIISIVINSLFVFLVLYALPYIQKRVGENFIMILRKIFGVILLAISVKMFTTNLSILMKFK